MTAHPSNRADRFASNRISAHGSDSKVVDDWFVVPWDRVPNHSEIEPTSPPIEGWFGPQALVGTMTM